MSFEDFVKQEQYKFLDFFFHLLSTFLEDDTLLTNVNTIKDADTYTSFGIGTGISIVTLLYICSRGLFCFSSFFFFSTINLLSIELLAYTKFDSHILSFLHTSNYTLNSFYIFALPEITFSHTLQRNSRKGCHQMEGNKNQIKRCSTFIAPKNIQILTQS